MREYLFRGKTETGEWIYGAFCTFKNVAKELYPAIVPIINGHHSLCDLTRVDPATVGQYTGLKDNNGKKIFEGDICRPDVGYIGEIKFVLERGAFLGYSKNPPMYHHLKCNGQMRTTEVIGNIHDNPELLEATT